MRIGEVARRTGVSVRSLRYYEQKRLLCAQRLENGYRDLDEQAVERVKTIQLYLGLGLTTEQIEAVFTCSGPLLPEQMPGCEEVLLAAYEGKLQEIVAHIAALRVAQVRLEDRITCLKRHTQG